MLETLLAGIGISAAAGLNVTLPLIVLALADRVSETGLGKRFHEISSTLSIILILLAMPVELLTDKSPLFSHQFQAARRLFAPLAGAFAFAAINSIHHDLNGWLAAGLGFAVTGAVTTVKAHGRENIMVTGGAASLPIVSMVEDAFVLVISVISALIPIANIAALPLAGFAIWKTYARFMRTPASANR